MIGYLPAEHIETPSERLARLNKHRNIDNGAFQPTDPVALGTKSSKFSRLRSRKGVRVVAFGSPKVIEYDAYESESESDSEYLVGEGKTGKATRGISTGPTVESHEVGSLSVGSAGTRRSITPEEQDVRKYTLIATAAGSAASPSRTRRGSASSHDIKLSPSGSVRSHAQKDSQGSHQSDISNEISAEESGGKDKKKKGVFSGLFKKRSKRGKDSTTDIVTNTRSPEKGPESTIRSAPQSMNDRGAEDDNLDSHLDLPPAVREMRSSMLMDIDPVTAEMIEEPNHRGPVDEVEMMHAQRAANSASTQPESLDQPELFVWTDSTIATYLSADPDMHRKLILLVQQQARLELTKNRNTNTVSPITAFDKLDTRIESMMKVCNRHMLCIDH